MASAEADASDNKRLTVEFPCAFCQRLKSVFKTIYKGEYGSKQLWKHSNVCIILSFWTICYYSESGSNSDAADVISDIGSKKNRILPCKLMILKASCMSAFFHLFRDSLINSNNIYLQINL